MHTHTHAQRAATSVSCRESIVQLHRHDVCIAGTRPTLPSVSPSSPLPHPPVCSLFSILTAYQRHVPPAPHPPPLTPRPSPPALFPVPPLVRRPGGTVLCSRAEAGNKRVAVPSVAAVDPVLCCEGCLCVSTSCCRCCLLRGGMWGHVRDPWNFSCRSCGLHTVATHKHTRTHACTHTDTLTHACTHTVTLTHACTHTDTLTHACSAKLKPETFPKSFLLPSPPQKTWECHRTYHAYTHTHTHTRHDLTHTSERAGRLRWRESE